MHSEAPAVVIVSDETDDEVGALVRALESSGTRITVLPASALVRSVVTYVRSIDPALGDDTLFARVAALSARPSRVVNTPASVRLTEWSPLVTIALRERGVPHPERVWCLDEDDLARAATHLAGPLVVESVVSRRRVSVAPGDDLARAFALTTDGGRERGAIVEAAIEDVRWRLSFLLVDGTAHAVPGRAMHELAPSGRYRAGSLARAAVEAVGGTAMAVDLAVTAGGDPYVLRIDAAPHLERVGIEAREALRRAIATRLAPRRAARPRTLVMRADARRPAHQART